MGAEGRGSKLMGVEEKSSVVPSTGLLCGMGSTATKESSSRTGPVLGTESRLRQLRICFLLPPPTRPHCYLLHLLGGHCPMANTVTQARKLGVGLGLFPHRSSSKPYPLTHPSPPALFSPFILPSASTMAGTSPPQLMLKVNFTVRHYEVESRRGN